MTKKLELIRENVRYAQKQWAGLSRRCLRSLNLLTVRHRLVLAAGDMLLIDNNWYITHSGLLRLALRWKCAGITVEPIHEFCDPGQSLWVFRATVHKTAADQGFVGYGDASPENVSLAVRGSEMRIAETRAVNRALRKAYGVGICSIDELGAMRGHEKGADSSRTPATPVRDRLCALIQQHRLDANLVKRYAAQFCGTQTLREASRELVEDFVDHIEKRARDEHDALVADLQGFAERPDSTVASTATA